MEMVQFRSHEGLFVIRLFGDLQFQTSAAMDLLIGWIKEDKSIKRIVVDLSKATMIDSTNLGMIAQLGLFAHQKHEQMPILGAGASPNVKKTLSKFQLHKLFRWKGDEEVFGIADHNFIQCLGPAKESENVICERAIAAHAALISLGEVNVSEFTGVMAGLHIERAMLDHAMLADDQEKFDMPSSVLRDLEEDKPYLAPVGHAARSMH